jgi:hypothetical protein
MTSVEKLESRVAQFQQGWYVGLHLSDRRSLASEKGGPCSLAIFIVRRLSGHTAMGRHLADKTDSARRIKQNRSLNYISERLQVRFDPDPGTSIDGAPA